MISVFMAQSFRHINQLYLVEGGEGCMHPSPYFPSARVQDVSNAQLPPVRGDARERQGFAIVGTQGRA
jgi:hypothetical protein